MVRSHANRLLVRQVFESGQVELNTEIKAIGWGVLCELAELVERFYRPERVLASDVAVDSLG